MFAYDGPVYRFLKKIADVTVMHLLWFIASIPLITLGASTAALYHVSLCRRNGENRPVTAQFMDAFRRYWKPATGFLLVLLALGLVIASNLLYWNWIAQGILADAMGVFSVALCVPYGLLFIYGFAVLVWRDVGVWETVKQALFLAYLHPTRSLKLILYWFFFAAVNCSTIYVNVMTLFIGFGAFVHLFTTRTLLQILNPSRVVGVQKKTAGP